LADDNKAGGRAGTLLAGGGKGGDAEGGITVIGAGIYLKVADAEGKRVVAACDEECLGNVYEDVKGGRVLDLETNRYFYEGELAADEEIVGQMMTADSLNLVGERAVRLGLEAGLVEEAHVVVIGGVPHAQGYRIRT